MKTKAKIFFVLAAVFLAGIGVYIAMNNLSCRRLSCLSIKDKNQYRVKTLYEENKNIFRALFENGDNLLRAEIRPNSTQIDADGAIQTQLARTKGVFEDAAAPYPGEISDVISCSKEYKPVYSQVQQNGIRISYFEGYVNERLVFGSCADSQAAYHDTLAMFFCEKQKQFYQLEIIIPREKYVKNPQENTQILNSIACAK